MSTKEDLSKQIKDIESDVTYMLNIVDNGRDYITWEEATNFEKGVEDAINKLNEMKTDVLKFYDKL